MRMAVVCGVSEGRRREKPGEEDISAESHLHSETEEDTEHSSETDTDEECRGPFSCSAESEARSIIAQNSGLSPKHISAPEASTNCGTAEGAKEKKFQCYVCKQNLSSKYQLQVHLGVHTGNNPYICPICKRALASKTSLIVHTKQHTRVKPYICPICKKAYTTKTSLKVHAKQHTEGKTFKCLICKKEFLFNMSNQPLCPRPLPCSLLSSMSTFSI
uniref:C2H2-type domain-containing protein n=1 Tax=Periophthalmus magnuspinnatus TaxID=409849 RepID=A0A3B4BGV1_9GOBI